MNKYTAVFGKHLGRIISTGAESTQEADAEIERQLKHPGRFDAFNRWVEDGRMMIMDDNIEVVTAYTNKETQQMQDQMFDAGVGYGN